MTEELPIIDHPIEGFFLTTQEDLIFDVKGLIHPPGRIICFLRYFPVDSLPRGIELKDVTQRSIKGRRFYKAYSLSTRYDILQQFYPQYLYYDKNLDRLLQAVPNDSIKFIHHPIKYPKELQHKPNLDTSQKDALHFCLLLHEATGKNIGITGSILIEAHTTRSDIDLVIYTKKKDSKIYRKLQRMFKTSRFIHQYSHKELKRLQKSRAQDILPTEDFVQTEKRKTLQGIYVGESAIPRDFYIRLVDPSKLQDKFERVTSLGEITVSAQISEEQLIENTYFTPAFYQLSKVKVIEGSKLFIVNANWQVLSYRGRFCECARPGEKVKIKGDLEQLHTNPPMLQIVPSELDHYILLSSNGNSNFE